MRFACAQRDQSVLTRTKYGVLRIQYDGVAAHWAVKGTIL